MIDNLAENLPPPSGLFLRDYILRFSGVHSRWGLAGGVHEREFILPWSPLTYLLEVMSVCDHDYPFLLHSDSVLLASLIGKDGVRSDPGEVARTYVKRIRRLVGPVIKNGVRSYGLSPEIGTPLIFKSVLFMPHINEQVRARLRSAVARHAVDTY